MTTRDFTPDRIVVIRRGPEFIVIAKDRNREWVGFETRDEAEAHANAMARAR